MKDLTNEEFINVFKNETKLEEYIQNMNMEKLEELLLSIHSRALGISYNDDSFEKGDMILDGILAGGVKSLKSPPNDIQAEILKSLAESLKNIDGKKNKAVLLHYIENFLHLFTDGNGRAGRAILELFLNEEFNFDSEICKHDKYDAHKISTSSISEKYGIMNIETDRVATYANHFLYKVLVENGMINDEYSGLISIVAHSDNKNNPVYIDENIKQMLSKEQIEEIVYAMTDGTGVSVSINGLCCLIINSNKKNISKDSSIIGFDIDKKETFED